MDVFVDMTLETFSLSARGAFLSRLFRKLFWFPDIELRWHGCQISLLGVEVLVQHWSTRHESRNMRSPIARIDFQLKCYLIFGSLEPSWLQISSTSRSLGFWESVERWCPLRAKFSALTLNYTGGGQVLGLGPSKE